MATLILDRVWVTLVETGVSVSAYSSDRSRSAGMEGTVQRFAGGRQRAITSVGVRKEFSFKLRDLTETQIQTLEGWLGQTVVVRDHRGRKHFGVFFGYTEDERKVKTLYDVSLTLTNVTYQEGA